jgi:hypothetical protein
MLSSPKDALARLIGDPSLNKFKLCHGFPIIAKAISGMTAPCKPPATGKNELDSRGLDPAIHVTLKNLGFMPPGWRPRT